MRAQEGFSKRCLQNPARFMRRNGRRWSTVWNLWLADCRLVSARGSISQPVPPTTTSRRVFGSPAEYLPPARLSERSRTGSPSGLMSTPSRPRVLNNYGGTGTPRRTPAAVPRTPNQALRTTSIKDQIRALRQAAATPPAGTPRARERREAVRQLVRKAADTGSSEVWGGSSSCGPSICTRATAARTQT